MGLDPDEAEDHVCAEGAPAWLATMGDLMTKTRAEGGLDFGTAGSSAVLGGVLIFFIVLSMRKHRKLAKELPGEDPSLELLESEMEGR